jgi:hypothetical protein
MESSPSEPVEKEARPPGAAGGGGGGGGEDKEPARLY